MKRIFRIQHLLILLLALLVLTGCASVPDLGQGLVIGESYRLNDGETLDEDLTVVGGNATLDEGSTVNGDVAVVGGNVTVDGDVNGNLTVMGGYVYLDDNARIEGNVESLGGTIQRSSEAVVEGKDLGDRKDRRITTVRSPAVNVSFEPITATLGAIFQAFALAALAILAVLFAPRPMQRAAEAAVAQAPTSGGVGCLTLLVLTIMTITIILSPISIIGFLLAGVAALFGWLALGLYLGRRLAVWLNQPWSDPVNAGVGTLVLTLLASLLTIIPCIGWLPGALVGLVALGAVVLTRFGTQSYTGPARPVSAAPGPYTPPAPVVPTVIETPGARVYDAPGDLPADEAPRDEPL